MHRDGNLAHLQAERTDAEDRMVATAKAIARVIPLGPPAP